MRAIRALLTLIFFCVALIPTAALAADQVDLLLVLAVDVSRSVDATKFQLQREGYAAALSNPRVIEAIQSGRNGRIGVIFVEWSGVGNQKVVIDWTLIGDAEAAKGFGDRLLEAPRSFADRTSISGGIEFAMAQLALAPYQSTRRTIDVSGDGTNNSGRDVTIVARRSGQQGHHHQRSAHPQRESDVVEPRPHQSAGWPGELLPQQRHRRPWRIRHGGEELQYLRRGNY